MVVEPNAFFEPMFYENQHKYPDIKMEKFIVSSAEDMKEVGDNSIGIKAKHTTSATLCYTNFILFVCFF